MSQNNQENVAAIRKWLSGLDNYPTDFDDLTLKMFLHSCYFDLEKTKMCIEKFCTKRYNLHEVYTNRDPVSDKIKTAFSIVNLGTFRAEDNELIIFSLDDPTLEKFNCYDVLKAFSLLSDYYIMTSEFPPDKHYFLLNMQCITWKIVPKVNIFFMRTFFVFCLETMPVRLKQIHLFNCPSYVDKLYALIKPCLPQDIRDIVQFHTNIESVCAVIGKQYLPRELGGDVGSLKEAHLEMVKGIQSPSFRKKFQDDTMWKAGPKKETNKSKSLNTNFKTLSID